LAVFDKYWPIISIKDQGGYEILSIVFPNNDCFGYVGFVNSNK
jgi:hypothetical protein